MAAVSSPSNLEVSERLSSISCVSKDEFALEPDVTILPANVQQELEELEAEFNEGDITSKGYQKRRSALIAPFLLTYPIDSPANEYEELVEPDLNVLPPHIIQQLDVLKEELENDEITRKGFTKKRTKILGPFMLKEPCQEDLPSHIQKSYKELEVEFEEGDLTEKGYKKKIRNLIKPFLVAVHPSSYSTTRRKYTSHHQDDMEPQVDRKVIGIQTILKDGQKVFRCDICGDVFKQAQSFSGHCRLHRGDRRKRFKCSICGSTYTTKSHLKFHMYKHTGSYPFSCSFCGKGFAGRSQHKYHELRHTGETPYNCKNCGARFWKRDNMELHQKKACLPMPLNEQLSPEDDPMQATDALSGDVESGESEGAPFVCNVTEHCSEVFEDENQLTNHLAGHGFQSITMKSNQLENESPPTMTSRSNRNTLIERSSIKTEMAKNDGVAVRQNEK